MSKSRKMLASAVTLSILSFMEAEPSRADSASGCAASTAEQARSLADELYRQGLFQSAGECYQAAGDLSDANESFVKATRHESDDAAKDLEHQGQIAKALFTGVQQAFRSSH